MATTLDIYGLTFANANGIKATDDQGNTQTFVIQSLRNASVTLTPSTDAQETTILPGTGYTGLGEVSVTVTAMPIGSEGTPTATKGSVSNHSVTVTPSVTNTEGYIDGGTRTGTVVTVTAAELVSGTLYCDDAGNWDVTNAETFAVQQGTAGTPTATKGTVSNHSVSITPSVSNSEGWIGGGTKTGTAVSVSASELVSGNLPISQNANNIDVTNYQTVSVNVPGGGSSKNAQAHQSTTRATSSSYTNCNSFTCTKAGTYTVYWSCMRSSTSGTSGSQLYINGTAYGSADTSNWSNHIQNKTLTGVTIGANQSVAVYARSRGSNYYSYVPLVTIIEE